MLLPLAVAGLVFSFVYRAPWFRETLRYSLQGVCLAPIFVVAMRDADWGPFRFLNLRWVRHVGVLSYSLYLLHHAVIYGVEQWLPRAHPAVHGVLALGIALALAEAIHRVIERPCARLRQQLAHTNWLVLVPAGGSTGGG
jgi:peptidoglycan/LPS O-acetylase OafA/YrhL